MKKIIQLVLWVLVLQLVGYGMGMITEANLDPWYASLYKSSLTPPGYVFGMVWSVLYIMLAIAGWYLYHVCKLENVGYLRYKSSYTPSKYRLFSNYSVPHILSGIMAVIGWYLYHFCRPGNVGQLRFLFITQLLLNWLWTPLFFHLHWIGAALVCLLAIVLLTTRFLSLAWKRYRILFWLMLPYWFWVCFASYLNYIIWYNNLF